MTSTMAVGGGIIELCTLFVFVWAIVSVFKQPSWAYQAAGKSKAVWVLWLLIALVIPIAGFVICLYYLMIVNPKVRAQAHLDQRVGFPGGPPPY
jgi:hypothetical protein